MLIFNEVKYKSNSGFLITFDIFIYDQCALYFQRHQQTRNIQVIETVDS